MFEVLRRFSYPLQHFLTRLLIQLKQLKRVFQVVWQASRYWTVAWGVLLLLQGTLPAVTVILVRELVNELVQVGGRGVSGEVIASLLVPAGCMAGVLVLTEVIQGVGSWVRTAQSERVQDYVRNLIHEQATSVDYAFYESSEYYDRLSRATGDATGQSLALMESTGSLLQNSLTLLAMAAILLAYGWWLPLILLISTLPAFYVTLRLNRRNHRWWERTTIDRRRLQYYELALTHSAAAAEVRLFHLGPFFRESYQKLRRRLYRERMQIVREQNLGRLLAGLLMLLGSAGALLWMGRQLLLGTMTLGDLALFYQAFNRGQGVMRSVLGNLGQIHNNSLLIDNLFEFLQLQPGITDPLHPKAVPDRIQLGIHLRDVTFCYPGSDRPVLEQFNLFLPAGRVVAIVGDNGAGKSTLVKLLCRLYDPQGGRIELDGIDLRDLPVHDLRRLITVLFQDPLPYHCSAAENIALGDIYLSPTLTDLETAARGAGIHNRIQRLPQGYETQLGKGFPGGVDLSGGEWQRLALARAFLRRAQLMILDEPTSAMDPWAESDWLDRFRTLADGRTAVVITHRFTLAMRADLIYVMRMGKVVEAGTHSELLVQNGLYAQSWRSQMETVPLQN